MVVNSVRGARGWNLDTITKNGETRTYTRTRTECRARVVVGRPCIPRLDNSSEQVQPYGISEEDDQGQPERETGHIASA